MQLPITSVPNLTLLMPANDSLDCAFGTRLAAQDFFGGFGPNERFGVGIVAVEIVVDRPFP